MDASRHPKGHEVGPPGKSLNKYAFVTVAQTSLLLLILMGVRLSEESTKFWRSRLGEE